MSKLHQPHGRAEADTARGELRKPDDQGDQPGQGADPATPLSQRRSVHSFHHERDDHEAAAGPADAPPGRGRDDGD